MATSPHSSFDNAGTLVRVISNWIDLIDPSDMPLTMALGGLDSARSKFRFVAEGNTKLEWIEDGLPSLADALNGAIADGVTTTFTVDDGTKFQPGMVLLVESEGVLVSAVSGNDLTVVRGWFGSAVAHADNTVVTIVSMARAEGADSDEIALTDRTVPYNYTEIFHHGLELTGTDLVMNRYGASKEWDYQVAKAIPHLGRLIEQNWFYGVRNAGTKGSASDPRSAGGLSTFISTNVVSAGGAVTKADFINAAKLAYTAGGTGPFVAPVHPDNATVIDEFLASEFRVTQEESAIGMVINTVNTRYGQISLLLNRWAETDKIYLLDASRVGMYTLRPFMTTELSRNGDAVKQQIVCEVSYCVSQDEAHAVITTIS